MNIRELAAMEHEFKMEQVGSRYYGIVDEVGRCHKKFTSKKQCRRYLAAIEYERRGR